MSLKSKDCVIDKIVYLDRDELPITRGKIVGLTKDPSSVIVRWDTYPSLSIESAVKLLSEKEVLVRIAALEKKKSLLDKEFEEVKKNCHAKMKQAAALVAEATKMADSQDINIREEFGQELDDALYDAGWTISSR